MKKLFFLYFLLGALVAISCDRPAIDPGYKIGEPRMLAIKLTNPEIQPGETVTATLLMGGTSFDQNNTMTVRWLLPPDMDTAEIPIEYLSMLQAPYNTPFTIPAEVISMMLEREPLKSGFTEKGWADLPVYASVTIEEKTLSIYKVLRVSKGKPTAFNPKITEIKALWKENGALKEISLTDGASLSFTTASAPDYIALKTVTEPLEQNGNGRLLYRWSFSHAADFDQDIEVINDKSVISEYLGNVDRANQNTAEMVIHLMDVKTKLAEIMPAKPASYNFYLIIRDKADDGSIEATHFGIDFIRFRIEVSK